MNRRNFLDYQFQIHNSKKQIKALIGGTGCGKTFSEPLSLECHMRNNPGQSWIVSAPTVGMIIQNPNLYIKQYYEELGLSEVGRVSQVKHNTYYEVKSPRHKIIRDIGTIYFISAKEPDRMQGIHAAGIFGDEAGLFPKEWIDVAIQRVTFTGGFIELYTTWYDLGWLDSRIYQPFLDGDPNILVVDPPSWLNPHYPIGHIITAKKTLPTWRFDMMYAGKRPDGTGRFQLFAPDVVLSCIGKKSKIISNEKILTCDIAREGQDLFVLGWWDGWNLTEVQKIQKSKGPEVKNRIRQMLRRKAGNNAKKIRTIVDSTGLGAFICDDLEEENYNIDSCQFSESAVKLLHSNVRTEIYFELEEAMRLGKCGLPDDSDLKEELLATETKFDSKGRNQLIKKAEISKKLGRSPDMADMVAMRYKPIKEFGAVC